MNINPGQLEGTLNDEYTNGWVLHTATQGATGRWTLIFETDRMRAAVVPMSQSAVGTIGVPEKRTRKSRKLVESDALGDEEH